MKLSARKSDLDVLAHHDTEHPVGHCLGRDLRLADLILELHGHVLFVFG